MAYGKKWAAYDLKRKRMLLDRSVDVLVQKIKREIAYVFE